MNKISLSALIVSISLLLLPIAAAAQQDDSAAMQSTSSDQQLVIGTKIAPPFVMKNAQGEYEGISIALWESIAQKLNLNYRFEEAELAGLLSGLENDRFDASLAAITVTAERESKIDFTHPFYTTGLAIATVSSESSWMSAIGRFFSWEFAAALITLSLVLLLVGFVLWLFERKKNQEMFGGSTAQGLGSSFWWAAVTMTTVGYGDKAPTTLGGRIVGLVWMFAAIIIISSFTAAIATSLTVSQLEPAIESTDDLYGAKVATIDNSASARFLSSISVKYQTEQNLQQALQDLADKKIDAVVYDKPILQYLKHRDFAEQIVILPGEIERQDYAIGLPSNSPLREALNEQLLRVIESEEWESIKRQYLGEPAAK